MQEGDHGVDLLRVEIETDAFVRRDVFVARLDDQRTQRTAHLDSLVVVLQHLLERGEAAVVHVGRGERDVAQRRHLEQSAVLGPARDLLKTGSELPLRIEAVVDEPVETGAEPAR